MLVSQSFQQKNAKLFHKWKILIDIVFVASFSNERITFFSHGLQCWARIFHENPKTSPERKITSTNISSWKIRRNISNRAFVDGSALKRMHYSSPPSPRDQCWAQHPRSEKHPQFPKHNESKQTRMLHSSSFLGHARQPLGARNHSSGVLRNCLAIEIIARTDFVLLRENFHISLCFVRDRSISNCALLRAVPSATSQAHGFILNSHHPDPRRA